MVGRRSCGGAALATCGLGAPAAEAAFPGRSGAIAVVYDEFDRGGGADAALRVVDRGGRVRATFSRCSRDDENEPFWGPCPSDPAFTADGRRIVHGLGERLALQGAGGGPPAILPRLTGGDSDPHPSPDGRQLVFTGTLAGRRNLFVVGVDGTGLRQLTRAGGHSPAWSSRGTIAYGAGGKLWRLSPGGRRTYLATGARPDWSPSGRTVAYVLRGSVYRVATRRGARRRIVSRRARSAAYSPDGRSIAFTQSFRNDLGSSLLTALSSNGSRVRRVTTGGELPIGSTWLGFGAPSWQPLR